MNEHAGGALREGASGEAARDVSVSTIDARHQIAAASFLALAACGGGGGAAGSSPTPAPTPAPAPVSSTQASRFLSQAAIGYSKADIATVVSLGFGGWLNSQFSMSRGQRFWDFLIAGGYDASANQNNQTGFDPMMWSQLISTADILRQRVGLALLDQWVVSIDGISTPFRQFSMAAYLDGLWDNAFGNYREIMEAVSTSTAMGAVPYVPRQSEGQSHNRVDPR